MKPTRICLIVLMAFFFVNTNAQLFTGGSIGIKGTSSKVSAGKTSAFDIKFMPVAGKFLSEKLAAGVALDINLGRNRTDNNNNDITNTTSKVGISPFLRYYAFTWNKFSLYGEGRAGVSISSSKSESNGIGSEEPWLKYFSLDLQPGLSYDISDRLSLQTALDFLKVEYNFFTRGKGDSKTQGSSFNLGGGLDDLFTLGSVTIGAIYKF